MCGRPKAKSMHVNCVGSYIGDLREVPAVCPSALPRRSDLGDAGRAEPLC